MANALAVALTTACIAAQGGGAVPPDHMRHSRSVHAGSSGSSASSHNNISNIAFVAVESTHPLFDKRLSKSRLDCTMASPAYPLADTIVRSRPPCSAVDAYYGIGAPVDLATARACAFQGVDTLVLAMLYANGEGVKRDFGAARKAVCDADSAPAEVSGRLEHLARMEVELNGGKQPERFDICDDITSGYMQGYCTGISTRLASQEREAKLSAIVAHWPATHRTALTPLRQSMTAFQKAHDREVDLTGTDRSARQFEAADEVHQQFFELLMRSESKKFVSVSGQATRAADVVMNEAWRRLRATKDDPDIGSVKLAGIVDAQRAWRRYRDEWIQFGRVRYPSIPANAWTASLTKTRTEQLRELFEVRR